jgi:hypothetical protein
VKTSSLRHIHARGDLLIGVLPENINLIHYLRAIDNLSGLLQALLLIFQLILNKSCDCPSIEPCGLCWGDSIFGLILTADNLALLFDLFGSSVVSNPANVIRLVL